jgi:hypothetical protein
MNKLEKGKLQEIDQVLYQLNLHIISQHMNLQKPVTQDDLIKITNELARCIRQLRNLQ